MDMEYLCTHATYDVYTTSRTLGRRRFNGKTIFDFIQEEPSSKVTLNFPNKYSRNKLLKDKLLH